MLAASVFTQAIYVVEDLCRVSVPAGGVEPGELGPFDWIWPRSVEVTGILVVPSDGLPASLAKLSLEIFDETERPLATDGQGLNGGNVQAFAMPCRSLFGRNFRPFALERAVRAHDRWRFTLKNFSGAAVSVAAVGLYYRDLPR